MEQEINYYEVWNEDRPKIPPGVYSVLCVSAGKRKVWWNLEMGSLQEVLWMQICDGEFSGKTLPMFLPVRREWNGKVPRGSKLYLSYFVANGMKDPERARVKEMSPRIFIGKVFKCWVRDTRSKFLNGSLKPEDLQYSVVEQLIDLLPEIPGIQEKPEGFED